VLDSFDAIANNFEVRHRNLPPKLSDMTSDRYDELDSTPSLTVQKTREISRQSTYLSDRAILKAL
ncbi:MAG: hypothetical protein AAGJ55_01975, partial [Cyanobacteria bacterium J06555_12]